MIEKKIRKEHIFTVTSNYSLNLTQDQIDFVNVPLNCDLELFINPFALKNSNNEVIKKMNLLLIKHFNQMLKLIIEDTKENAMNFIIGFSERNMRGIHLGYSHSKYGKSIGFKKAEKIYDAFIKSNAIKTGNLKNIEETILLIEGISNDSISDMILGMTKEALLDFTMQEAKKYSFDTKGFSIKILNDNGKWILKQYNLPYNKNSNKEYIILTPKNIIVHTPRLTIPKAYSFIWNKLKGYKNSKTLNLSLILNLKDNEREKEMTKKEFKKYIPESKQTVINFFEHNPSELNMIIDKYNISSNKLTDANKEIQLAYIKLIKYIVKAS